MSKPLSLLFAASLVCPGVPTPDELYRQARYFEASTALQVRLAQPGIDGAAAAPLWLQLGDLLRSHSHLDAAADALQRAALLASQAGHNVTAAHALHSLGVVRLTLAHSAQAEIDFHRALAALDAARAPGHERANVLTSLAMLFLETRREALAGETLSHALRSLEHSPDPAILAWTLNALGDLHHHSGRLQPAGEAWARALAVLPASDNSDLRGLLLNALGGAAFLAGDDRQAAQLWRDAIAFYRSRPGRQTSFHAYAPMVNLAELRRRQRRFQEAIPLLEQTAAALNGDTRMDPVKLSQILNTLGSAYLDARRPAQAAPVLARALQLAEQHAGLAHVQTGYTLVNLAALELDRGRHALAETLFHRAAQILARPSNPPSAQLVAALEGRAAALRKLKRGREATQAQAEAHQASAILPGRHTVSVRSLRPQPREVR
jgi:tetratricopeptide (TPR) repeat protein